MLTEYQILVATFEQFVAHRAFAMCIMRIVTYGVSASPKNAEYVVLRNDKTHIEVLLVHRQA